MTKWILKSYSNEAEGRGDLTRKKPPCGSQIPTALSLSSAAWPNGQGACLRRESFSRRFQVRVLGWSIPCVSAPVCKVSLRPSDTNEECHTARLSCFCDDCSTIWGFASRQSQKNHSHFKFKTKEKFVGGMKPIHS